MEKISKNELTLDELKVVPTPEVWAILSKIDNDFFKD